MSSAVSTHDLCRSGTEWNSWRLLSFHAIMFLSDPTDHCPHAPKHHYFWRREVLRQEKALKFTLDFPGSDDVSQGLSVLAVALVTAHCCWGSREEQTLQGVSRLIARAKLCSWPLKICPHSVWQTQLHSQLKEYFSTFKYILKKNSSLFF